jgi:hypothetical protein
MNYWDKRYASGGNSGCGSIGKLRDAKWKWIQVFVDPIKDVIDVGCGDLSFWEGKQLPDGYIGIDGSEVIIGRNKRKHPNNIFYKAQSSESLGLTAPVVFCFDMLFHIMDDDIYKKTIENLCSISSEYIFIYTWMKNPILKAFGILKTKRSEYECYRDPMEMCRAIETNGFKVVLVTGNKDVDPYGVMFVFRRNE